MDRKRNQRYTIEECQQIAKNRGGKCLSNEYVNAHSPLEWQCSLTHTWKTSLNSINTGRWCPHCCGKYNNSIELCHSVANEKGGLCLDFEFKNLKTMMTWQCKKGHTWKSNFNNIKRNKWCPVCAGVNKHTIKMCQLIANERGGLCLDKEYLNLKVKMKWQCSEQHTWYASFDSIKNQSTWCPYCIGFKFEEPLILCQQIALQRDGKCLSNIYVNNMFKMTWQCKKGHTWLASLSNVKNRLSWCPLCKNEVSRAQQEIFKFLINYFPDLNIILNDTRIIKPKHLDIYISELKIGIEYDGEYWHYSDWAIKEGSLDRMNEKDRICKEEGIKLLRIREKNWTNNKERQLQRLVDFIESSRNV